MVMKISIIGAGYVGLVSSICLSELNHTVTLIDNNLDKVETINSGNSPIYERGLEKALIKHINHNLRSMSDYDSIPKSDLTFICVGTPLSSDSKTDLRMIKSAVESIGMALRNEGKNHVVVVRSTVPPGTTDKIIEPLLQKYVRLSERNIKLAVNPEFLREGSALQDFFQPDRIVIGCRDAWAADRITDVYKGINSPILRTDLITAEMIKYASNAFLATKISFSNEIGNICKSMGINTYEVMGGVGMDHRIGAHFLNPGVGFGGSCLPKDLAALIKLAESHGEHPLILKSVLEVNEDRPMRMIRLLEKRLGTIKGKRIAVIGLAFKNGTDDIRESRAIPILKLLIEREAQITAYDPVAIPPMRILIPDIIYCDNAGEALKDADACLILTEWPEFGELNEEFDMMRSRVIIEGRKVLSTQYSEGLCW